MDDVGGDDCALEGALEEARAFRELAERFERARDEAVARSGRGWGSEGSNAALERVNRSRGGGRERGERRRSENALAPRRATTRMDAKRERTSSTDRSSSSVRRGRSRRFARVPPSNASRFFEASRRSPRLAEPLPPPPPHSSTRVPMFTTPARAHGAAQPSRVTSSSRASSPRASVASLARVDVRDVIAHSRGPARAARRASSSPPSARSPPPSPTRAVVRARSSVSRNRAPRTVRSRPPRRWLATRAGGGAAADGRASTPRDDIVARVDVIEREYGFRSILDVYHDAVSRAARTQRKRDAAKPRARARDRACHRPKARQGWTKAEMRRRRVRTCVGCENMRAREEMFRVIRVREEKTTRVVIDDGAHGRSAYVCKSRACVARAKKNKSVNKGLRCAVGTEVMEALEREATAFEEEAGVDTRGLVFERPDGVAGRWEKPESVGVTQTAN